MGPTLYAHPFSSYCQKVLIALYENATEFEYRLLAPEHPDSLSTWAQIWPLKKMPVLVDSGETIRESSVIIEHLALVHPGPVKLIPADPRAALHVRFLDRFFDNYVMTPMQKIVLDHLRPPGEQDARGVEEAKALLQTAYRWLDAELAGSSWASGESFTLADCAAAPSLFYADWVGPIPEECKATRSYRQRLLARPSVARAVDEARPYRKFFPPGAPDRD